MPIWPTTAFGSRFIGTMYEENAFLFGYLQCITIFVTIFYSFAFSPFIWTHFSLGSSLIRALVHINEFGTTPILPFILTSSPMISNEKLHATYLLSPSNETENVRTNQTDMFLRNLWICAFKISTNGQVFGVDFPLLCESNRFQILVFVLFGLQWVITVVSLA